MKQAIQLDVHPDAESLNAFAEQALPERERAQILEHLGVCARCRQVVYLAQEMAVHAEPVASAAVVRAVPGKTSWFGNGWLTWAPAAALAGIVGFAVFIHFRTASPGSEVAGITPQNFGVGPNPALTRPPETTVAAPPAAPTATTTSSGIAHSAAPEPPSQAPALAAVPTKGIDAEPGSTSEENAERVVASAPPGASGHEIEPYQASVQSKSGTAAWQQQQEAQSLSSSAREAQADKAGMNGRAMGAQSNQDISVSLGAPHAQYDVQPKASTSGTVAHGLTAKIALPSGLSAVSFAAAQHVSLALDSTGGLFVSTDLGSHWTPVAHQWNGHAVAVRLESGQAGQALNNTPGARFQIVTDSNQIWVSTDGRHWTAK